jgi:hypothetical protein
MYTTMPRGESPFPPGWDLVCTRAFFVCTRAFHIIGTETRQRITWIYPKISKLCSVELHGYLFHAPCNYEAIVKAFICAIKFKPSKNLLVAFRRTTARLNGCSTILRIYFTTTDPTKITNRWSISHWMSGKKFIACIIREHQTLRKNLLSENVVFVYACKLII